VKRIVVAASPTLSAHLPSPALPERTVCRIAKLVAPQSSLCEKEQGSLAALLMAGLLIAARNSSVRRFFSAATADPAAA
jgi:hypothetical protein